MKLIPQSLIYTKEEIYSLIDKEEQKLIDKRQSDPSTSIYQYWVPISISRLPLDFVEELRQKYLDLGWKKVDIQLQDERGQRLYVCLQL